VTDVSIVIAAHARAERLRALLASLDGDGEVVVAADGATPEVHAVLAEAGVRVVRLDPGRGPAAARNAGWRAASGRLVAFTDDDCLAAPGWVAALAAAAGDDGDVIVQGRVEPHPDEVARIGPFTRTLRVQGAGPFFQTANMLYPRAVLERLGGFDEAFPAPAGEDTDLGWRAQAAGVEVRYAPDALIWHAVHEPGWSGLVRDAPRWGSAIRLVRNHPGIRAHFHHRIFWRPSHERLLVAVAGVGLARRTRGASLVALAPWMAVHRGDHPGAASLVAALPAHLAVDAAEVLALARGSVRARTLLL
jgi:GT2 family glycosyltransferase